MKQSFSALEYNQYNCFHDDPRRIPNDPDHETTKHNTIDDNYRMNNNNNNNNNNNDYSDDYYHSTDDVLNHSNNSSSTATGGSRNYSNKNNRTLSSPSSPIRINHRSIVDYTDHNNIRPSQETVPSRHQQHRQKSRNSDVSELFLAEAKAAQAKMELSLLMNTGHKNNKKKSTEMIPMMMTLPTVDTAEFDTHSLDTASYNTFEATMGQQQQQQQRQHRLPISSSNAILPSSSSSIDAIVGPTREFHSQQHQPIISLHIVNDTVQMMTTTTTANNEEKIDYYFSDIHNPSAPQKQSSNHHRHHQHHSNGYSNRSIRKPLGLSYELRKTDSSSTFQSLDGLRNSYPLIRHESGKRKSKKQQSSGSSNNSSNSRDRVRQSTSQSTKSSSSKQQQHQQQRRKRSFAQKHQQCTSSSSLFRALEEYTNHQLSCFPSSSSSVTSVTTSVPYNMCTSMDHILQVGSSFVPNEYRNRYASTAYDNSTGSTNNRDGPVIDETVDDSNVDNRFHLSSRSRELRTKSSHLVDDDDDPAEIKITLSSSSIQPTTTTTTTTSPFACCTAMSSPTRTTKKDLYNRPSNTRQITPDRTTRGKTTTTTKQVHFAKPLVTKVSYRPYTDPCDIAELYFQEDELEELEYDREMVLHDQFECQYDEIAVAIHIAYQQMDPSDE